MDAHVWAQHPRNPVTWSALRKWKNVSIITYNSWVCTVIAPMLVPANSQVAAFYGVTSKQLVLLATAIWVLAQGLGPIFIAPISELYGRKVAYTASLAGMAAFILGSAFAPTIGALIVLRFFAGFFSAVAPALGSSTTADAFDSAHRGFAQGVYNIGPVLGPVLGPVIGSYLALTRHFIWIHWTSLMLTMSGLLLVLVLQDETYIFVLQRRVLRSSPEIIKLTPAGGGPPRTAPDQQLTPSVAAVMRRALTRPPRLMVNPFLICFALLYAWVFALVYLLVVSIPLLFGPSDASERLFSYRWSNATFGLAYLGVGAGNLFATLITMFSQDRIYVKLADANRGEGRPEYRLILAQYGGLLLPVGFLIWGWTAQQETAPVGPLIGEIILGCGLQLAYSALQVFIVDASQPFSAAAVAATNILRNVLATLLILFGPDMFEALSWGRGGTLIACLSLPILPLALLMLRVGPSLRRKYPIKP